MLQKSKHIPPISIIVSAYAESPFLEQTLASIIGQLDINDELIVFHNGVEAWGTNTEQLNGVKYTTYRAGRRLGWEQSWSQALILGKNDWILWMHDDDLLRDGALSQLKKAVSERPAVTLAYGNFTTFSQEKTTPDWPELPFTGVVNDIGSNENLARYLFSFQHMCSGLMMKRSALAVVLPIPIDFGASADVWLFQRLAYHGDALFLQDVTVAYRWHSGNETHRCLSTFKGRRAWSRSRYRQRGDCCNLIQMKQLTADFVANIALKQSDDVILDTMRSLIRAQSSFAKPLANAIEDVRPEIIDSTGWKRIKIALALGPWSLEVTGALEAILRICKGSKQ